MRVVGTAMPILLLRAVYQARASLEPESFPRDRSRVSLSSSCAQQSQPSRGRSGSERMFPRDALWFALRTTPASVEKPGSWFVGCRALADAICDPADATLAPCRVTHATRARGVAKRDDLACFAAPAAARDQVQLGFSSASGTETVLPRGGQGGQGFSGGATGGAPAPRALSARLQLSSGRER